MSNVMPPLSEGEYKALKASIEKSGVLVPVEVDEDTGELLDGHHRLKICQELGIEAPRVLRSFKRDEDRKEHALTLNLMRRHLGPISWAESFRKLAEVRGVRLGSGGDRTQTATVAVCSPEAAGGSDVAREEAVLVRAPVRRRDGTGGHEGGGGFSLPPSRGRFAVPGRAACCQV